MFDFKTAEGPIGRISETCSAAGAHCATVVVDSNAPQSDAHEAIERCLEHAFPISDDGSFRGLLRALDEA